MKDIVGRLRALGDREGLQLPHEAADELEATKSEPVAWMLKTGHGTVFAAVKPECEVDLWVPLYTAPSAPTVDVDAISDDRLMDGVDAYFRERDAINDQRELKYSDFYKRCMRAALRAIFNQGSKA